ncbi:hypothetical protein AGMMS50256_38600 [Betaproteobacteria bacterium]|nr:hypothetical protein AGMMS50256_38600 [Betaproteobacteria bacterium]
MLSGKQAGLAALSGVGTGALGFMGGKIAQRMGIADPETLLAGGIQNGAARKSAKFFDKNFITRMTGGAISESVFEELLQARHNPLDSACGTLFSPSWIIKNIRTRSLFK